MKVIFVNSRTKLDNTCGAIGIFDGVHRGHQYLLNAMMIRAHQLKALPLVITFFPHPAHVLRPDIQLGYVVSFKHRIQLLKELGVKACAVICFNKEFAHIDPVVFIQEMLVKQLGLKAVFVGKDFRFGRNRSGDINLFERMAKTLNYEMHAMPALNKNGLPVSSTRIRALITAGKLTQSKTLLGRPFSILGQVVKGSGRGKSLGYPTANIAYESDILPPLGVYAARVIIQGTILNAVMNLGVRPSFKEPHPKVHLEVHIFDFKQNLYGKTIEVQIIKKIRSEKKFQTPQALIEQIRNDTMSARRILK